MSGRNFLLFLTAILSVTWSGCAEPSRWDRIPLVGTAQLDGQPFEGSISFRPAGETSGPAVMTKVRNGEFRFDRKTGPVVGDHFAILLPRSKPGEPPQPRIDHRCDVPAEEPFQLQLEFESPTAEPDPVQPVRPTEDDEFAK